MTAYATSTDLERLGLNATALASVDAAAVTAQLLATSRLADGYLSNAFSLPLSAWGDDLRGAVCKIAVFELLSTRGYDPARGADETVLIRYNQGMGWLKDVANGRTKPVGIVDATPAEDEGGTYAVSNARRGWMRR